MDRSAALQTLIDAARAASDVVMRIYEGDDVGAELKAPGDPVTRADREANALLVERLRDRFPGVPIVAEESDPSDFQGFGAARAALFVDPVDGTRDFIAKSGEFCVMVGLAEDGRATAGVVLCPASSRGIYAAAEGVGAFVIGDDGARTPLSVSTLGDLSSARCVVSRLQRSKSLDAKLAAIGTAELVPRGSSGIKGVEVAAGRADLYAHPSRGLVKLWDACAPDAIVRVAGGLYTDARGTAFDYRGAVAQGRGTLAGNAALHAEALRRLTAWESEHPEVGG